MSPRFNKFFQSVILCCIFHSKTNPILPELGSFYTLPARKSLIFSLVEINRYDYADISKLPLTRKCLFHVEHVEGIAQF